MMERRAFLKAAVLGAAAFVPLRQGRAQEVPNSSGTSRPKLKAPAHACDCHLHIYDPERFAFAASPRVPPSHAALAQYRMLQKRLGTTRAVIVTPRNYGTGNRATVDAIAQIGADARGIAVVHPSVTDADMRKLHAAGVRGIRFSLGDPPSAVVTPAMIEPLAKRVADFGWHV